MTRTWCKAVLKRCSAFLMKLGNDEKEAARQLDAFLSQWERDQKELKLLRASEAAIELDELKKTIRNAGDLEAGDFGEWSA